MIATDWFMTEMQSCSPIDFWKLVHNTFEKHVPAKSVEAHINKKILWELWTSQNAIRWINLKGKQRIDKLEAFYDQEELPIWWKSLKLFYEKDLHLDTKIKKYLDVIEETETEPGRVASGSISMSQAPEVDQEDESEDSEDYSLADSDNMGWPNITP